ncbi:cell wall-binding repeat-containing protein [Peptostreptococcus russellii]|uniref:cell wall-binding repeat-containing protein n=1 Tax=Peptostreptococcus russellii TaxID=215200 RepID=UPI0026EA6F76|nr:cell wall-binding repeat-containing protein [Peptostreptococcus russellii]
MRISKNIINGLSIVFAMIFVFVLGGCVNADTSTLVIRGKGRVETSIESSELVDSKIMVVASARSFADSLSAYNIASSYNAKLILVNNNTDLTFVLKRIKPRKVYLIGGESSLGGQVVESISNNVPTTVRIFGSNRYETNERTLKEANYSKVGVADGRNYPDALAASSLLKNKGLGLKLVDGSKPYKVNREVVYTYGGKNSVKQNGGKRLAGDNRYATSDAINKELGDGIEKVALTTGESYADALSAINLVNSGGKVSLMLVRELSPYQEQCLSNIPYKYIIGGQLSNKTVLEIEKIKNKKLLLKSTRKSYKCSFIDILGEKLNNSEFEIYNNTSKEIESSLPNGYKVVSDANQIENLKSDKNLNKIYVAKKNIIILNNQDEYNRYIFNGLKSGFERGEVITNKSIKTNSNLERIADGMGFTMKQNLIEINDQFNKVDIKMSVRQEYYTKEKYDKDEYARNMEKVSSLIENSGARDLKSNRKKAIKFAKYLKVKYPYNKNVHDHVRSRSPYSITKYHTGVCEAFTYTYNQAMLLLGIPSYQVEGTDIDGNGHMEAMVYCNGKWEIFNTSGYINWCEMNHNDLSQISEGDIENTILVIENDPYSDGLINRVNQELSHLYRL